MLLRYAPYLTLYHLQMITQIICTRVFAPTIHLYIRDHGLHGLILSLLNWWKTVLIMKLFNMKNTMGGHTQLTAHCIYIKAPCFLSSFLNSITSTSCTFISFTAHIPAATPPPWPTAPAIGDTRIAACASKLALIQRPTVIRFFTLSEMSERYGIWSVSYTHLTLPTKRIV